MSSSGKGEALGTVYSRSPLAIELHQSWQVSVLLVNNKLGHSRTSHAAPLEAGPAREDPDLTQAKSDPISWHGRRQALSQHRSNVRQVLGEHQTRLSDLWSSCVGTGQARTSPGHARWD